MKNTLLKISLPVLFVLAATSTFADHSNQVYQTERSWYVAANGLHADYEGGIQESGYNVAVGKYLNNNISLELGYADFGGDASSVSGVDAEFEATAIQFSAVGYLPLSENAGLFTRVGLERIKTDSEDDTVRANLEDTNPYYGVGAYVNVSENVDLRVEVQRHEILEEDLDTFSAGITIQTY